MFKRRSIAIGVALALAVGVGIAASPANEDRPDYTAIYKIKDEGINRSQIMETLSYLTDVHGPRLTGSPQLRKAQEWTQDQLKKWGIENVGTHKWEFGRGWQLKHFSAHMTAPSYAPLIAYPKAWTPGFPGGAITGPAVRVDIASEADFDKYKGKLKGAYVLTAAAREIQTHFTADGKRYTDQELADLSMMPPPRGGAFAFPGAPPAAGARGGRGGAAAQPAARGGFGNQALQRKIMDFYLAEGIAATVDPGGRGDDGTVFVQSGGTYTKDAPAVPAEIVVATEQYNRMIRILEKDIPVSMEVDYQAEFSNPDGFDYDITGEIPGTDKKDEVVMVGGHFDSWHTGTGATDNGAGSAAAMEVMRILKATGLKMRRTVRIGLWTGEEEGLLGSCHYVNDVFASRPGACQRGGGGGGGGRGGAQPAPTPHQPDYDKFAGYFNIDNGTGKIRGVYLQGNEEVRPIFAAWLEPFKDMGATTLSIRNTGGTDHLSFDGVGLPGFQFIQDEMDYDSRTHHSNQDVWDRISRADMIQIAVIEASFVYHTAMREQKLPRKPLPTPRP
jgi:carboxypeptidase Q